MFHRSDDDDFVTVFLCQISDVDDDTVDAGIGNDDEDILGLDVVELIELLRNARLSFEDVILTLEGLQINDSLDYEVIHDHAVNGNQTSRSVAHLHSETYGMAAAEYLNDTAHFNGVCTQFCSFGYVFLLGLIQSLKGFCQFVM